MGDAWVSFVSILMGGFIIGYVVRSFMICSDRYNDREGRDDD